jgi:PD-(D/E)XK endonuclease
MGRPRSWTDDDLRTAVETSRSWYEVIRVLGLSHGTSAYEVAQVHAERLGLDILHLSCVRDRDPRTELPRPVLDRGQVADLLGHLTTWADLLRALGVKLDGASYIWIKSAVADFGLDVSHFDGQAWAKRPIDKVDAPFNRPRDPAALRRSATSLATAWFQARNYRVSVPVEPAPYDIVVESDAGLVRVQVKSTNRTERGRWIVSIVRQAYAPSAAGGRSRRRYTANEVDFFFIVTGNEAKYLIPLEVAGDAQSLTLDGKYALYKLD